MSANTATGFAADASGDVGQNTASGHSANASGDTAAMPRSELGPTLAVASAVTLPWATSATPTVRAAATWRQDVLPTLAAMAAATSRVGSAPKPSARRAPTSPLVTRRLPLATEAKIRRSDPSARTPRRPRENATAYGNGANASAEGATATGKDAKAGGANATAVGINANAAVRIRAWRSATIVLRQAMVHRRRPGFGRGWHQQHRGWRRQQCIRQQ